MAALGKLGLSRLRSGAAAGEARAGRSDQQALQILRDYEQSGLGWFWSTDAGGRIDYISDSVAQRLGKTSEELIGQPFSGLFHLETTKNDRVERSLPVLLGKRKTFVDFTAPAAAVGDDLWWSISGRPHHDAQGNFIGFRGNGADVTEQRRSQHDAEKLAMYDSLTGLSNRLRMSNQLENTLAAFKQAKRSCAVMMLDLDRFKQVNDTLGHPAGDELLKQVAERLGRVVEYGCELGRLGGDEFEVILPDLDDRGRLGEIAKKIIDIVSQPYSLEGARCVIGVSVGIAIAPYDGVTSEELIRNVDLALYAAKGGGRGQFRFYSTDLHNEAETRRRIEEDLRDALVENQISLSYQPLVDAQTNAVVAMEAVMRWTHPELGPISPALFIPVAEESNQIGQLGEWALRRACTEAAQWPGNVKVSVNVSPAQFANANLPVLVTQALANSGLAPELLELELTESIFLNDRDATDDMFAALKAIGVRLALDDFGTGYSSLGYLRKAPFDKIKIDQSFIRGVTEPGSRNVAIIKAIVSLAEALDMDTTAEGIEAHDELDLMRDLKVGQIQGYIYSKPIPGDDVLAAMGSGQWIIRPDGPSNARSDRKTVFRKIGLIHEDHRYDATMRNMSSTGCMIEGLLEVPVGTDFVVDFGEGQLAVATVRRSRGTMQGLEFEQTLVDDGAGGLVTRNRISPYMLASAGMPLSALPPGQYPLGPQSAAGGNFSMPRFANVNEAARRTLAREQG
ncbi:putative bifunctional diguanylate cyclase/phosphodiesterase [Novosphingobium sp. JCM 18896]|uniref:putative bifunctional diguanylate cyclase/phosphodiesterase n=1 Tax=Novosphingobium sp. JCM 18896 TaxID=2989731 RepID=UPI0022224661|nr:EAL domain-containing protein [Novosphingobium sp. JCM 18896]MCW1430153.1 EAL domain-containing protein [Novosphingobium sp. JCM 18896]